MVDELEIAARIAAGNAMFAICAPAFVDGAELQCSGTLRSANGQ
jgi:hypothetical protein